MAETIRAHTGVVESGDGYFSITWTLLDQDDSGAVVRVPPCVGLTAQLLGTLGTGGEITMQGSMDGTNWGSLTDGAGNAVVLGAIGAMSLIAERPLYIRPDVTGGDGDTSLTLVLAGHRAHY